jgi:hypothetical protein
MGDIMNRLDALADRVRRAAEDPGAARRNLIVKPRTYDVTK